MPVGVIVRESTQKNSYDFYVKDVFIFRKLFKSYNTRRLSKI